MSQAPADRPPARVIARSAFWWNVSKAIVLTFSRVWFRLRIEGAANVPASGPVLLVANHSSYLDPPMLGISCRRYIGFLAQSGLARIAPFRWWMRQVGVTLIDRDSPSKDAMRLIADSLKAGEVVSIFPEGTRTRDGTIGPFRTGVEFLVRRTGAAVLPVGIDGACRAWPRGVLLPRPRKIVVRWGEVWPAERVLAEGGMQELRARIAELARAPLRAAPADTAARKISDSGRSDTDTSPSSSPSGSSADRGA